MDAIDQVKTKMKAALDHLKDELKNIRTGRANPAMLDQITVEVYGAPMRLKDIATITVPESRQLLITPFDRSNTAAIGKAIEKANLGFMPIVDGQAVRIKIPPMDDSMRKDMIKLCHKKREEAKVSVRNIRRDSLNKIKTEGNISEDSMKKLEKNIQEQTDKFCKEADELSEKKENEVSTI